MARRQPKFYYHTKEQQKLAVFSHRVQSQAHKREQFTCQNEKEKYKSVSTPQKPIHVYSYRDNSPLRESSKATSTSFSYQDQFSTALRQLQMRFTKYNEFNRRNYEENPQGKKSLYIKNIRKSKNDLMKFQFQTAMQSMIAKKEVGSKMTSSRQTPGLLASIKQKIDDFPKIKRRVDQVTNKSLTKSQLKDDLQSFQRLQSSSLHFQGIKFKKNGQSKKKRRQEWIESSFEVRPWEDSRKLATQPPEKIGNQ